LNLTAHFTLAELTASDYATRTGIDNQPIDPAVLANLHLLADGLERVRAVLGQPIHISSGYRCEKLNAAVSGSRTSAHLKGLAADIHVPGITPRGVCLRLSAVADAIGFDQLIFEGSWTHIGFPEADAEPRRQILTAIFKPGRPTTYVGGIA
jgi:hypothetical protein